MERMIAETLCRQYSSHQQGDPCEYHQGQAALLVESWPGHARIGQEVRSNHPDVRRRGEWGVIVGVAYRGTEACWVVEWDSGDDRAEVWPIVSPSARYEFRMDMTPPRERTYVYL